MERPSTGRCIDVGGETWKALGAKLARTSHGHVIYTGDMTPDQALAAVPPAHCPQKLRHRRASGRRRRRTAIKKPRGSAAKKQPRGSAAKKRPRASAANKPRPAMPGDGIRVTGGGAPSRFRTTGLRNVPPKLINLDAASIPPTTGPQRSDAYADLMDLDFTAPASPAGGEGFSWPAPPPPLQPSDSYDESDDDDDMPLPPRAAYYAGQACPTGNPDDPSLLLGLDTADHRKEVLRHFIKATGASQGTFGAVKQGLIAPKEHDMWDAATRTAAPSRPRARRAASARPRARAWRPTPPYSTRSEASSAAGT